MPWKDRYKAHLGENAYEKKRKLRTMKVYQLAICWLILLCHNLNTFTDTKNTLNRIIQGWMEGHCTISASFTSFRFSLTPLSAHEETVIFKWNDIVTIPDQHTQLLGKTQKCWQREWMREIWSSKSWPKKILTGKTARMSLS